MKCKQDWMLYRCVNEEKEEKGGIEGKGGEGDGKGGQHQLQEENRDDRQLNRYEALYVVTIN